MSRMAAIVCAYPLDVSPSEIKKRNCERAVPIILCCQMTPGGTIVTEMLLFRLIRSNFVCALSVTVIASPESTIRRESKSNAPPQEHLFYIST